MPRFYKREIKEWATTIPIKDLLDSLGESYIKSGKEWRWSRHDSVTFKHNLWFQHSTQKGGNSVSLLTTFFDREYDEAVEYLLREFKGKQFVNSQIDYVANTEVFEVPEAADNCRKVFAYLIKSRYIAPEVIGAFVRKKLIYQSKHFGNVVFVGHNEDVEVVFAHERGTTPLKNGNTFKKTVYGSDFEHGFRWEGTDDTLIVFEAPIDMLAYITLHKEHWVDHSYIAQCGTSGVFLHAYLKRNPQIKKIIYALDHDVAGNTAARRMMKEVRQKYGNEISQSIQQSTFKDWDEDLKGQNGVVPIPAEEDQTIEVMKQTLQSLISDRMEQTISPREFMDIYAKISMSQSKNQTVLLSTYEQLCQKAFSLLRSELGISAAYTKQQLLHLLDEFSYSTELKKSVGGIAETVNQLKPYFSNIVAKDAKYVSLLQELVMDSINQTVLSYPQQFELRQERRENPCMIQSM